MTTLTQRAPATSVRQRVGLGLAAVLNLASLPSVLEPTPDGEVGPPFAILLLGTVLAVVGLAATYPAWRGSRVALRVVAGTVVLQVLSALPAFFVDVPAGLKAVVGIVTLMSIATLVLMFSPARRPVAVVD